MFLKIMGDDDRQDSDPGKAFRIIECREVEFKHCEQTEMPKEPCHRVYGQARVVQLSGMVTFETVNTTAFVMSDEARTVARFRAALSQGDPAVSAET
jgi:hypothetical protein